MLLHEDYVSAQGPSTQMLCLVVLRAQLAPAALQAALLSAAARTADVAATPFRVLLPSPASQPAAAGVSSSSFQSEPEPASEPVAR